MNINSQELAESLRRAYLEHVRKGLHAAFMAVAEKEIEAAVREAMKPIQARVELIEYGRMNRIVAELIVDGVRQPHDGAKT